MIVCVGLATRDTVYAVPRHPGPDERVVATERVVAGGGPAATAAVTIARLGVPVRFAGVVDNELEGVEVLRIRFDTPYVRNLPTRLTLLRTNRRGGVVEQRLQPSWSDPFVEEWRAFGESIRRGSEPKTSPQDFREDLELLVAMVALMR